MVDALIAHGWQCYAWTWKSNAHGRCTYRARLAKHRVDLEKQGTDLEKQRAWSMHLSRKVDNALRGPGKATRGVRGRGGGADQGRTADRYREHVRAAGMTGPVSFEQSRRRQRVRLHDTRATFVTVSLANGKSAAWVHYRTGHKSSTMISEYRRAARMAAEVGMAPLVRMDVAVGPAGHWAESEGGVAVVHLRPT